MLNGAPSYVSIIKVTVLNTNVATTTIILIITVITCTIHSIRHHSTQKLVVLKPKASSI